MKYHVVDSNLKLRLKLHLAVQFIGDDFYFFNTELAILMLLYFYYTAYSISAH